MLERENQKMFSLGYGRKKELNERALSPIFATLIILAVVTVLFIPVFIWATGTSSQSQESWQTSGLIATERIVVEEVNLKGGATSCNIYVRNIGKTAVTINDVIIVAPNGNTFIFEKEEIQSITDQLITREPVTKTLRDSIVQGELIEIFVKDLDHQGLNPYQGQVYTVKVFTTRGVGDVYQVVA